MTATLESWDEADSAKAHQIWVEYQQQHDLSGRLGQTAGIDPHSERIWFGESVQDIVNQRDREGLKSPLFFERVGSETYYRKGSHRSGGGCAALIHPTVSAQHEAMQR